MIDSILGNEWTKRYRPGGVAFSADHVAALLKVDLGALSRQSGLSTEQLRNEVSSPAVQGFLTTVMNVLLAAYFVIGDLDRAVAWYHQTPVFGSGVRTAEDYVSLGQADSVLAYLESLEVGAIE